MLNFYVVTRQIRKGTLLKDRLLSNILHIFQKAFKIFIKNKRLK